MQGEGAKKAELSADNRQKLRQAKQHARELALAINATKRQIDALKISEGASVDQVGLWLVMRQCPCNTSVVVINTIRID